MEQDLEALAQGLPTLDLKVMSRVVKGIQTYPTAALRVLFKKLDDEDPSVQAVAERILAGCRVEDVVDNLKATVFDVSASSMQKVRANDLLSEVDMPIDPDVLEMSVPNAAELAEALPSRVYEALEACRTDEALERFGRLAQAQQAMLVHRVAAQHPEGAVAFLARAAAEGEYLQHAVLSAIGSYAMADALDLVLGLADRGSKDIQKEVKRTLFELKAAGVDVPEQAPVKEPEPKTEPTDDELPLHRVLLGEGKNGEVSFVSVARRRPSGRLKVLIMMIDPWQGGIRMAAFRSDASQSAYERSVRAAPGEVTLRDADIEEVRSAVSRALAAAKALGTRIPLDFQLGRSLLGDLEEEIAPFRCVGCGAALGGDALAQVRDAMVYQHVKVEKRCQACRDAGVAAPEESTGSSP